jgi:hypothetical protein
VVCNSSKKDFTCFKEADQYVYMNYSSADTIIFSSDLNNGVNINVDVNTNADTDANTNTDTNININVDVNIINNDAYSRHCLQKEN